MIASTTSPVQVQGNLSGENVAMDFDPTAIAHLQSILINMYTDPERAVIRELACNGRDATVEAGSKRPIEVTTPTVLSPFFTVRDYGCGLSADDIRRIFSKIGASTKRDTNDQTGCLGIGSKSPLAYAPQFTVSSVKNGRRIEAIVSLDEAGAGQITLPEGSEVETDEPNGTEITVPAKRHNSMATKARDLFSFWPEGSVLLDGEPVAPITGTVLTDKPATARVETPEGHRDVKIERMVMRDGTGSSVIIMGGVPYPIPTEQDNLGLGYSHSIVVWVGMGEIDFAPNRENLRLTTVTKQALKGIHDHFDFAVQKAVQKAINECSTAGEALRLMLKWTGWMPERLRKDAYSYRGKELPTRFKMEDGKKMTVINKNPRKLSSHSTYETVASDTAAEAIWFYNYDRPSFTPGQRKKINHWSEQQWPGFPYGADVPEHFILCEKMPQADFIDPKRCFDWETTIKPVRLPRESSGGGWNSGRLAGSYDAWVGGSYTYEVPADDVAEYDSIYYFVKQDRWTEQSDARSYVNMMTHFKPDCIVVWLTSNRVDKFVRNFPEAKTVQAACEAIRSEWLETVDEETKALIAFSDAVDTERYEKLAKFGPYADPRIQATIDRLQALKCPKLRAALAERDHLLNTPRFNTDWREPITKDRYPMAFDRYGSYLRSETRHLAIYLNAAFQADVLDTEVSELTKAFDTPVEAQ